MSILDVNSRFSNNPVEIDIPRSRFDRSHRLLTTMNASRLVPIFCDEVLPGDTFDLTTSALIRMSTPIYPVMDNAYVDTYFFFVPNRLVWSHWKELNGENNESAWTPTTEYMVPQLRFPVGGFNKGSVADYFGIPTNVYPMKYVGTEGISVYDDSQTISALPFRAYVKCWEDWFRDQNYLNPAYFTTDDVTRDGKQATFTDDVDEMLNSALYGGDLLPVAKFHDYFTSVLPQPQKGPGVNIGINVTGDLPVSALNYTHSTPANADSLRFSSYLGSNPGAYSSLVVQNNTYSGDAGSTWVDARLKLVKDNIGTEDISSSNVTAASPNNLFLPAGSYNNLSMLVNDIRLGFQLQKLFEKDARSGSRYIEVIRSHFGVSSPDGRLQRSEYLGGARFNINIQQVAQTSATNDVSPQGNMSAYSLTIGQNNSFIKSFTEHGFIIGVACIRTDHTYQQGLSRMWSRKRRFDFYWPVLANIGEQPVLKKEIYFDGVRAGILEDYENGFDAAHADEAFGYQEAWADYRYKPSFVTGAFRSNYAQSLDSWHYADDFEGNSANFVADANFMIETKNNIDRTLAVSSDVEDQFLCDFHFNLKCTRVMPVFSIPGLVDHH